MAASAVALGDRASRDEAYRTAWSLAHATVEEEHDARLPVIEGALPRALSGTMYRNGPARFERGGRFYGHLFDGDGMVSSFRFDAAGVSYRNRWVRTREHDDEARSARVVHRGFGTPVPGGMLTNVLRTRFKNAANTGICLHAGKLLALWEGGLPHGLDPVTLATLGRETFAGRLLNPRSLSSAFFGRELPFSAHPKIDPVTSDLINFGLRMGPRPRLLLYQIRPDGQMAAPRSIGLDALWFIHDFALTAHWMIFALAPVAFRTGPMLLGRLTPAEALAGDPDRSFRVLAVSRASLSGKGPPDVRIAEAKGLRGFTFHLSNAFEDGDRRIVLDAVWTDRFPEMPCPSRPLPALVPPRLVRFHVDLARGVVERGETSRALLELPEIDPRLQGKDARVAWGIGAKDEQATSLGSLVRLERGGIDRLRDFAPDVVGPPLFVPRAASEQGSSLEGDGWILATLYSVDRRRTELLVLDATDLSTVARVALPHVLPPGFHGTWVSGTRGDH